MPITTKETLTLSDNNPGLKISEEQEAELSHIANRVISDIIRDNPSILLFPFDIEKEDDQIGAECIYGIYDHKIVTGNIAGFIGFRNMNLSIHSRFCEPNGKDYFLHYLMQKVFLGNIFDFPLDSDDEQIFDFLLYFFPQYLKNAVSQGIYRKYTYSRFNNANVRGAIDIPRHIATNYPFSGRIAYSTRLLTVDNPVTQLIRHTIEYLRTTMIGSRLLKVDKETRESVMAIINCTSSYSRSSRRSVINQNLKSINHPFYTAYRPLQKLCMAILNHEELAYGQDADEVKGLLFDCSWLWEEYLATLLTPLMEHSRNRKKEGGIKIFSTDRIYWYPDFYSRNPQGPYVIDAKYKHETNPSREDMQQIISYIYLLRAMWGGFAFPESSQNPEMILHKIGILNGYGSPVYSFGFAVPHTTGSFGSFSDFVNYMQESEKSFLDGIRAQVAP